MAKLRTATGKEFECDYFNPFLPARQTNLRVLNTDIAAVAAVFSNPEETKQLYWEGQYAAMYINLKALVPEGNAIRVVLEA